MSSLPERKKSPEEIAKLREHLGIRGKRPPDQGAHQAHDAPDAGVADAVGQTRAVDGSLARPSPAAATAAVAVPPPTVPKPVRSLRKSERVSVADRPVPRAASAIPQVRHSDDEIARIRRREALALMHIAPDPRIRPAHPLWIAAGYLAVAAAAAGAFSGWLPPSACASLAGVALAVAAVIGLRKPVSRHHAAFILALSLLALIFGALHYFPQLLHAT
jgi:hypothetical protein